MLSELAKEHICRLGDQQLAEYIATGEQMYEREAVEFARRQFAERRLNDQAVVHLKSEAHARVAADSALKEQIAATPMDWDGKVLSFIGGLLGIGGLPLVFRIWVRMDIRGQYRKAKDMKRFYFWGFAINMVVLATVFVVSYVRWREQHL
jgi:hypothetical protein